MVTQYRTCTVATAVLLRADGRFNFVGVERGMFVFEGADGLQSVLRDWAKYVGDFAGFLRQAQKQQREVSS